MRLEVKIVMNNKLTFSSLNNGFDTQAHIPYELGEPNLDQGANDGIRSKFPKNNRFFCKMLFKTSKSAAFGQNL